MLRFVVKTILHWLILSCAVLIVTYFYPKITANPPHVVFIVGAVIAVFNIFVKPIVRILTLPLNILTLGLFSLILNGILFWYLSVFIDGFAVANFYSALVGSVLVSVINWVFSKLFRA